MHSQHSFKRKCVKYLSRLILGSVLLLVLYVISLGPIVAVFHRPWLSSPLNYKTHPDNALVEGIYSPIYDFNAYGCQLSFEQAPPWRQQQLLWLNEYVSFCRELKYSLQGR